MFKFGIGEEVYIIYRAKNNKGIRKWYPQKEKRKIIDINIKYIFEEKPFKVRACDVYATYEEAEQQCEYRNHWGKYHKPQSYRGRRKKKK